MCPRVKRGENNNALVAMALNYMWVKRVECSDEEWRLHSTYTLVIISKQHWAGTLRSNRDREVWFWIQGAQMEFKVLGKGETTKSTSTERREKSMDRVLTILQRRWKTDSQQEGRRMKREERELRQTLVTDRIRWRLRIGRWIQRHSGCWWPCKVLSVKPHQQKIERRLQKRMERRGWETPVELCC